MNLYEGMTIKTFPETDVDAYVRFIHDSGFKCYVRSGFIRIGTRTHEPIDREARARKLRQARKLNGLTRAEVAEKIHVNEETLYSWEIGRTYPSKKNLQKLIDLYCVQL